MRVKFVVKDWVDSGLQEVSFQERVSLQDGAFYPGAILDGVLYLSNESEQALSRIIEKGYYLVMFTNEP